MKPEISIKQGEADPYKDPWPEDLLIRTTGSVFYLGVSIKLGYYKLSKKGFWK